MDYSIAISINIKNNSNVTRSENLIYDIGKNCNSINIYFDHELEGENKHIKKNNSIIIFEFENIKNLIDFINFIKTLKNIEQISIDYIYNNNNIIFANNKYLNSLKDCLINKKDLILKIEENKLNINYKEIFDCLKLN